MSARSRGKPEHPRRRIAGLRPGGDRADLDEAKADREQRRDARGILVEAGREPERPGELKAERAHPQRGIARPRAPAAAQRQTPGTSPVSLMSQNAARWACSAGSRRSKTAKIARYTSPPVAVQPGHGHSTPARRGRRETIRWC